MIRELTFYRKEVVSSAVRSFTSGKKGVADLCKSYNGVEPSLKVLKKMYNLDSSVNKVA